MLDPASRAEFERQYQLVLVIYAAMLVSIFIYLGIGFLLVRTLPSRVRVESAQALVIAFYGLAAVLIGVILWLRKSWIAPLAGSPSEMLGAISKYRTGHIVVFVLCEVITLFGLALLFLTGSFTHLLYLAALSLMMMIVSYPKKVE